MPYPLAERLREATRALHTEVERAGFMRQLLRGQVSRDGYAGLLRSLHPIYVELEAGLVAWSGHPGVAPLFDARLFRAPALARDLVDLLGPHGANALEPSPAALHYALRLRRLAAEAPAALAAHAYVRYLGDLSGGQMLARVVGQALGLPPGIGLSFYDFGPPDQVKQLAARFRRGLDELVDDAVAARALVDEACHGFELHKMLFDQLMQAPDPALP